MVSRYLPARYGTILAIALLAGVAVAGWYWLGQSPKPAATDNRGGGRRGGPAVGPVPVSVAMVRSETVPVYRQGIGNVVALNNVTVRTQVDGRLVSVDFVEGQDVKKGDVLARIDPTLYQAAYDQALAKKAQDEANLKSAKLDLQRYQRLAKDSAGTQQQADQQVAAVAQIEAQIKSDIAAAESAKATLGYTTIVAPFDGRIGLRSVDPGNIVHASDANGIATLAQVKPIAVVFTLPQRDLPAVSEAKGRGAVVVEVLEPGGRRVLARGSLAAIDNQIDLTTGTIRLKAVFSNEDLKLWPGQFVSTRVVVETLESATTVPTAAIRRGPTGTFVYVVDPGRRASVAAVDVVLQDETRAVVGKGLSAGAQVVTVGFAQLTNGAAVVLPADQSRGNPSESSPAALDHKRDGTGATKRERRDPAAANTPN